MQIFSDGLSTLRSFVGSQTLLPTTQQTKIVDAISPAPPQDKKCACCKSHAVAKTLTLDNSATIPLFDLDAISSAQGLERKVMIDRFGDSLKEVGFIAVKAEALTPLIEAVNREMSDYFHQPLENKMKDWHNNNAQTGFSPQGKETAAGAKKADIKETYFIPPAFDQWPKERSSFQSTMQNYHGQLTDIATQVMTFFAEYLEEPTEDIAKSMGAAHNLLRLAYYPAKKPSDDPEAVWAAAHEDLNAFTLLPPSTVPGLQLLTKNNEWKPVNVPKGYLIVNTGEQLQYKTAGLIKATRHQVLNPGNEHAYKERFASIFFASWSSGFSLKPFESCLEKTTRGMSLDDKRAYAKQFPDVSVLDNLISRLIEMGTIADPTEENVKDLRSKGLLQKPPQHLLEKFPTVFKP